MAYSETFRGEIVAAYLSGKSAASVAAEFGCSGAFVALELKARGIPCRGVRDSTLGEVVADEVVARYATGESIASIARALSLDERPITSALTGRGITIRKTSRKHKHPVEVRRVIAERYMAGESSRHLCREYEVAVTTLSNIVRECGGTMRQQGSRRGPLLDSERDAIVSRYEGGESQADLGAAFGLAQATVSGVLRMAGVKTRGSARIKGENHPSWKGGRHTDKDGYIKVRTEEFPAMRGNHAYIGEHRLVMARHLGRALTSREQVHHRNGMKGDNRVENLELRIGPHGAGSTEAHCSTCTCFNH